MPRIISRSLFVVWALLALPAPGPLLAQKFAYSDRESGANEIYVAHIEGSGRMNITNQSGG